MKVKGVIGKKIVGVDQERVTNNFGQPVFHISRILLDDGSCICLDVEELQYEYAISGRWRSKKELER